METLLISRSQVETLLNPATLLPRLRDGFISYSRTPTERALRVRSTLPGTGSATVLFPGLVPDAPVYAVKVHAKYPHQSPAIRGVLCLHSLENGELLCVMDSTHLTAMRTGAAGALAADALSRRDADTVAVIGAGVQGRQQLLLLASLRRLRSVSVYDLVPGAAAQFCREMAEQLGVDVRPAESIESAVRDAGIVLVATWSREPLLFRRHLAPGVHVNTLGADEPGKVELSGCALRASAFFCDDRKLAVDMGALAGAELSSRHVAAEIGEVFSGARPGRTSDEQITVFASVGLAFQDALCAWQVYQAALERNVGRRIDFLG